MSNKQPMLGKKIVIIAEDVTFANTLENIFNFAGVEVYILRSIDEGIPVIKAKKPDLILLENISDVKINDAVNVLNFGHRFSTPMIIVTDSFPDTENNSLKKVIPKEGTDINAVILEVENMITQNITDNDKIFDITEKNVPKLDLLKDNVKVLLIEDDPLLRNLLSAKFEKEKIAFEFYNTGDNAVKKILEYQPSIVILDIMLPGKNGLDVLSEIRQTESLKDLRVVIFSNKDNDEERVRAKELGVKTFLTKAMTDLNELIYLILQK